MNNTNRALNRTLIMAIGVVLIVLGAAIIALAVLPAVAAVWDDAAPAARDAVAAALTSTPLGGTGHSYLWIALALACLLGILLLSAFVVRQGHGHESRLVTQRGAHDGVGSFTIDSAVAERSLAEALATRSELVSSSVSTYGVKGAPVLKVAVTARRGVSPRDVTTVVEQLVRAWDTLLGREIPVLIHISGGFRTRVTKASRLQ